MGRGSSSLRAPYANEITGQVQKNEITNIIRDQLLVTLKILEFNDLLESQNVETRKDLRDWVLNPG